MAACCMTLHLSLTLTLLRHLFRKYFTHHRKLAWIRACDIGSWPGMPVAFHYKVYSQIRQAVFGSVSMRMRQLTLREKAADDARFFSQQREQLAPTLPSLPAASEALCTGQLFCVEVASFES